MRIGCGFSCPTTRHRRRPHTRCPSPRPADRPGIPQWQTAAGAGSVVRDRGTVRIITFSAEQGDDSPIAQVQLLIRSHDPLVELTMPIIGHRQEDRLWRQTLRSLAAHFGSEAEPTTSIVCVDRKRQWHRFGNIRSSRVLAALAHPRWREPVPGTSGDAVGGGA